jgi:hypothetical protein
MPSFDKMRLTVCAGCDKIDLENFVILLIFRKRRELMRAEIEIIRFCEADVITTSTGAEKEPECVSLVAGITV